ncbi:response regulator [Fulvivirgaceae bacterium PWU5]|uniref:Response regulator n=1 Tax=Dawidia cretensis TaxID=2782350 RepID=A0AAP2DYI2_9BACT|nr:response regulator [Dawidia cretensis]MBT1708397.1 response regulator [Dawidia cretensis]
MNLLTKSCLLISGDPRDHEVFIDVLSDLAPNAHFMLADNAMDALDFLEQDSITPDYIFVELDMIGINGVEFLRESKRVSLLRNVPVIIHSPEPVPEKIRMLKEMGAFAIFFRPYSYWSVHNVLSLCFQDGYKMCLN